MSLQRISTFGSHTILTGWMMDVQERIHDRQIQLTSEKRSQDYGGIADDSYRLINLENKVKMAKKYIDTNNSAATKMQTMETSLKAVDGSLRGFKQELAKFKADGPDDPNNVNYIQQRAWETLQDLQSFLNVKLDGQYLFAGSRTDTQPVALPATDLANFQAQYDIDPATGGISSFPSTRSGHTALTGYYYRGDNQEVEHRTDESRSIKIGLNANDPAIEKAMRGLLMIAQGGMQDFETNSPTIVDDAISLIVDSLEHDNTVNENSSDLSYMRHTLGVNAATVARTISEHKELVGLSESRISKLENADPLETATLLNDDLNSLQVSYTAFAKIRNLTLASYI